MQLHRFSLGGTQLTPTGLVKNVSTKRSFMVVVISPSKKVPHSGLKQISMPNGTVKKPLSTMTFKKQKSVQHSYSILTSSLSLITIWYPTRKSTGKTWYCHFKTSQTRPSQVSIGRQYVLEQESKSRISSLQDRCGEYQKEKVRGGLGSGQRRH